jgi:hypothetical protein
VEKTPEIVDAIEIRGVAPAIWSPQLRSGTSASTWAITSCTPGNLLKDVSEPLATFLLRAQKPFVLLPA